MAENECSSNYSRSAPVNESFDVITIHNSSSKNSNSSNSGVIENRSNIGNSNGVISVHSCRFKIAIRETLTTLRAVQIIILLWPIHQLKPEIQLMLLSTIWVTIAIISQVLSQKGQSLLFSKFSHTANFCLTAIEKASTNSNQDSNANFILTQIEILKFPNFVGIKVLLEQLTKPITRGNRERTLRNNPINNVWHIRRCLPRSLTQQGKVKNRNRFFDNFAKKSLSNYKPDWKPNYLKCHIFEINCYSYSQWEQFFYYRAQNQYLELYSQILCPL